MLVTRLLTLSEGPGSDVGRRPALVESVTTDGAIRAIQYFLSLKGIHRGQQQLLEILGGRVSPDAVAAGLAESDVPARPVRVEPHELPTLSLPTLAVMKGGSLAVVTSATRKRIEIEDTNGARTSLPPSEFARDFDGIAFDLCGASDEGSVRARLWRALRDELGVIARFAGLTVGLQAARLGTPLVIQAAMDSAIPNGAQSMLGLLALTLVFVAFHRAWLEWLRHGLVRTFEARLSSRMLRGVFEHILSLPFPQLQHRGVGELVQCAASTEAVVGLATAEVMVPVVDAIVAWSCIVLIAFTLPGLALCVVALAVVLGVTAALSAYEFARLQTGVSSASAKQRSLLYEIVEGAATIKIAAAETRSVVRWLRVLARSQMLSIRQMRVGVVLEVLFEAGTHLLTVMVLIWGGERCLRGDLSVGALLSTLLLAQTFMHSMLGMSQATLPLWGARSDVRRVDDVLSLEREERPALRGRCCAGDVVIEDLWFRYSPTGPWILQSYSLRIPEGTRHVIAGPSGMGKTTLLRLIAGLYRAERGRVTIGGTDASRAGSEMIAYLPQQLRLVEGTLWDNLVLLSQASPARIYEAAKATGLADLVESLPMKFETRLAHGGANFSGGQRQLVAFTACVASERPVVLLDEAFANMDRLMRKRLSDSKLFEGKTVIAVEHDGSSHADGDEA